MLAGWHEDGKNISSKKLQIKTNLNNATNILKYKANIIWSVMQFQILLFFSLPKANFVLQFFHIEVSSRVLSPSAALNPFYKKIRTVAVQKQNISKGYISKDYYNLTNGPTRLHLSEMKRISGSQYVLRLLTNSTSQHVPVTALSLFYEFKLVYSVLWRADLGRIYSSIT